MCSLKADKAWQLNSVVLSPGGAGFLSRPCNISSSGCRRSRGVQPCWANGNERQRREEPYVALDGFGRKSAKDQLDSNFSKQALLSVV